MDEKTKQEKINEMADKMKFVFDVLGTKKDINRMILNDKELRDFLLERIEFYRLFVPRTSNTNLMLSAISFIFSCFVFSSIYFTFHVITTASSLFILSIQ